MFSGIFIRTTLNLYPKLERTDILMMLECPNLPILGLCVPCRSVLWLRSHGQQMFLIKLTAAGWPAGAGL